MGLFFFIGFYGDIVKFSRASVVFGSGVRVQGFGIWINGPAPYRFGGEFGLALRFGASGWIWPKHLRPSFQSLQPKIVNECQIHNGVVQKIAPTCPI